MIGMRKTGDMKLIYFHVLKSATVRSVGLQHPISRDFLPLAHASYKLHFRILHSSSLKRNLCNAQANLFGFL